MLRIKDLTCGYNSGFLLKDISFEIKHGELLGVIGPNGSGKTTLLRAITRILKPKRGTILLEGEDIWKMGLKELAKKVAVVSQNPITNSMSVEEFVLLGRIPHYKRFQFLETNNDRAIAERCMALTNTLRLKDQPISKISSGEKQLAFIARALTQEPKLLLLDEPITHLDIAHQIGILDLIKRLNRESGLTVIMVLHDLNLASEYCDRLILFNRGHIHKIGTPQEVLTRQVIEEVYKTCVIVKENPINLKPYIFLVSEEEKRKRIWTERD